MICQSHCAASATPLSPEQTKDVRRYSRNQANVSCRPVPLPHTQCRNVKTQVHGLCPMFFQCGAHQIRVQISNVHRSQLVVPAVFAQSMLFSFRSSTVSISVSLCVSFGCKKIGGSCSVNIYYLLRYFARKRGLHSRTMEVCSWPPVEEVGNNTALSCSNVKGVLLSLLRHHCSVTSAVHNRCLNSIQFQLTFKNHGFVNWKQPL
eukprot:4389826-Amphidinium_carterae.2